MMEMYDVEKCAFKGREAKSRKRSTGLRFLWGDRLSDVDVHADIQAVNSDIGFVVIVFQ